jgi:hypothetical protein
VVTGVTRCAVTTGASKRKRGGSCNDRSEQEEEGVLVTTGANERKLRRREREGEGVSAFETERVETERVRVSAFESFRRGDRFFFFHFKWNSSLEMSSSCNFFFFPIADVTKLKWDVAKLKWNSSLEETSGLFP